MENCIFCKIVKGEVPAYKTYEDDDVLAFLDIKPFTKGHCLVIPKQHFEDVFDISNDALQKVASIAKLLSEKIKNILKADGIRLSQSNGKTAGQEVMHFHLHIIPRYENDGVSMNPTSVARPTKSSEEELKEIAEKLR